jgi:hypothetical protein
MRIVWDGRYRKTKFSSEQIIQLTEKATMSDVMEEIEKIRKTVPRDVPEPKVLEKYRKIHLVNVSLMW